MPDYICSTVIDAISAAGCRPLSYRIALDGLGLWVDEADVKAKHSPKTLAILKVDFFGVHREMSPGLRSFLSEAGTLLIRDAAHAFLSLVKSHWTGVEGYDALITSPYKSTACPIGAFMLTETLEIHRSGRSRSVYFAWLKRWIRVSFGRLFSIGVDRHSVDFRLVKSQPHALLDRKLRSSFVVPRWMGFLSATDVAEIIKRRQALATLYLSLTRPFSPWGVRALFAEADLDTSVLMAFPLVFPSGRVRNIACVALQKTGVDAYSWPIFHESTHNKPLWESLLLIPLTKDCSRELVNALSQIQESERADVPLCQEPVQSNT